MAHERLWVCEGCQPPKSDWSPAMKRNLLAALGGSGVLAYVLVGGLSEPATAPLANEAEPAQAIVQAAPLEEDVIDAPTASNPSSVPIARAASLAEEKAESLAGEEPVQSTIEDRKTDITQEAEITEAREEPTARLRKQDEDEAEKQRRYCASVTPEGRANAAYMASIGC